MKTIRSKAAGLFLGAAALALSAGIANAAMIYTSPNTNGNGAFTVFDTATGVTTNLGTTLGNMGLSFDSNNTLYGIRNVGGGTSASLYTVNLTNGVATLVGTGTYNAFVEAGTFDLSGRFLAGTTGAGASIYSVNTGTGASTLLGAIAGLSDIDGMTVAPVAVTYSGGQLAAGSLLVVDSGGIYVVDLNTLAATLISTPGINVATETLAFGADGTLYTNGLNGFHSLDLVTGVATSLGGNYVWGSAVLGALSTQIYEPAALALFGLGLAGIGLAARRKRKAA